MTAPMFTTTGAASAAGLEHNIPRVLVFTNGNRARNARKPSLPIGLAGIPA
jgi:hypothetical protein